MANIVSLSETKRNFKTFNDGIVKIYTVKNISNPGDRPKDGLCLKYVLRFNYQTIGIQRNSEAMQAQIKLNELISVKIQRDISTQDVAIIGADATQYDIVQAQHKKDTLPATSLLSLTKLEAKYEFATI